MMAMAPSERLEAVFKEADERRRAAGLPEPSLEEIVARYESAREGDAAMSKFVRLDETAFLETPAERFCDHQPNEESLAAIKDGNAFLDSDKPGRFTSGAELIAAALDDEEDEHLGRMALERLAAHEGEPDILASEAYAELGIDMAEIEAMPDVELE